jgi:hypothetical protein
MTAFEELTTDHTDEYNIADEIEVQADKMKKITAKSQKSQKFVVLNLALSLPYLTYSTSGFKILRCHYEV